MTNQAEPVQAWSLPKSASLTASKVLRRELADAIKAGWDEGEPADTRAALEQHPELRTDKTAVVDLAYEEYCTRVEAGEQLDPVQFCARFPTFQVSLRRLINVHEFGAGNPELVEEQLPACWPKPGEAFQEFSLVCELGRGAFARVFLATQPKLGNRPVAVKVSCQGATEVAILGRLIHPNIVPIHSSHEDPETGLAVACMPYLGSATLCDVLDHITATPRLPDRASAILDAVRETEPPDAPALTAEPAPDRLLTRGGYVDGILHLGVQMTEALAFIHAKGVYHRDLKPSNVLLTPGGRPMLLDFNLSFDQQLNDQRLGGSLPYLAPEQLLAIAPGGKIDPLLFDERADLFSLAVMLYELLTGRHPFGLTSLKQSLEQIRTFLLEQQQKGPRPVRELNPQVDVRLARLIERCLAYDRDVRPQSAVELAGELRRALSRSRRLHRWAVVHPWKAVAASLLTLTLLGAGGSALNLVAERDPAGAHRARQGLEAFQNGDDAQAVVCLNEAIRQDPNNVRLLFARSRAHQHLGQWLPAREDLSRIEELAKGLPPEEQAAYAGRSCAGQGYCYSHGVDDELGAAIFCYRKALKAGFKTPEVLNNLAFDYLWQGQSDENATQAQGYLNEALRMAPDLQAAYHNRAMAAFRLLLNKHNQRGRIAPPALDASLRDLRGRAAADIDEAFKRGPESAVLYADAANIHGVDARPEDPRYKQALEYARHALHRGVKLSYFVPELGQAAELQKVPATDTAGPPLRSVLVVDPVRDTDLLGNPAGQPAETSSATGR